MSYTVMQRADGRFTIAAHVPVEALEKETADRLLDALGPIVDSLEKAAGRTSQRPHRQLAPPPARDLVEHEVEAGPRSRRA